MDFSKIDLKDHQKIARKIIIGAIQKNIKTRKEFEKFRNSMIKKEKSVIFHNLYFIKAYNDLINENKIKPTNNILKLIKKRAVRTMSGVAPVTVLTKPHPCPGQCIYCPTDTRMPKSYLPSQPAAQRAFRQRFNPYSQVFVRLKALEMTGHEISKIELRIIGGTFSSYPKNYREHFIKMCLAAMNEYNKQKENKNFNKIENITKTQTINSKEGSDKINTVIIPPLKDENSYKLEETITKNETAEIKCIGINIETRPDFITENEAQYLRKLGVTKIEMGVQTTDEKVQEICKRGHTNQSVIDATQILKDAGFKIGYHMMPNLPGTTPEKDKKLLENIFQNNYQPDYLKIYPCVIMPKTELSEMYEKGEFTPYEDNILEDVLYENIKSIPYWCRVDRVARDIPANEIEKGFKASNIRQIIEKRLKTAGIKEKDIRSREIKDQKINPETTELVIRKYKANKGTEFFISYEDTNTDKLIALLRLRFPNKTYIEEIANSAIIREVHVYGKQIAVGNKEKDKQQHIGFGKKLMKKAENIAKENGYKKISVIAGIGTRKYYEKLDYKLEKTYMTKIL